MAACLMVDVRGTSWLLLILWFLASSVAFAQTPDSEQVFAPLLDQAERDKQAGQLIEARARANAFLARVSVGSSLAGRAHLVIAATDSVARKPVPGPDVIFEPLVVAAEADGVAGRNSMALARLSAAMSLVPADSALAARARNLYALVSRGTEVTSASPSVAAPPQTAPSIPPPAPTPSPQPQLLVLTPQPPVTQAPAPAPTSAPPVVVVAPDHTQPAPVDPDRRRGGEIAELRLAGGALGLLAGVYTLALLRADDALLYLTIPAFTTAAGVLAVGALDMDGGMPRGVPAAISTGVLAGFGDGLLIWGVARNSVESTSGVLSIITGATGVGAVVGGVFGYGLRPTIAESRFVLSAGMWGVWIGWMSSLAFDTSADRTWANSLIAYNAGLGLAMLVSGVTDVPMARVGLANAMVALGALMGLLISGVVVEKMADDGKHPGGTVLPAGLAIGSTLGLMAALLFQAGEFDPHASAFTRTLVGLDLDLNVTPVVGGATFGLIGKL